jgi:hypothetical protein
MASIIEEVLGSIFESSSEASSESSSESRRNKNQSGGGTRSPNQKNRSNYTAQLTSEDLREIPLSS